MRDGSGQHPAQHPALDDVQRYVDEALDPARGAEVAAHVAACDTCRGDVERLRTVTAALSLASAPPADLLERIQARRRANEHVILPVGDDAPPPPSEEERRALAALALASAPPADLLERIQARRAAGGQVLLPTVPEQPRRAGTPAAPRARTWQHAWRWAVGPGVAAAATFLAVRALQSPLPRVVAEGPAAPVPSIAAPAPDTPGTPAAPAVTRPLVVASAAPARGEDRFRSVRLRGDSALADSAPVAPEAVGAHPSVTERGTAEEVAFGFAAAAPELDSLQRDAVDRVARLVRDDATRRVLLRHDGAADAFLERVEGRLLAGDVPPERILRRRVARVRAGLPEGVKAVEVVIQRPRDDER